MSNEPRAMREIHDIRLKIYEDIKDLKPDDIMRYYRDSTKATVQKYGIKTVTPNDLHPISKAAF